MKPAIAVIGIPDLPPALRSAGLEVITDSTNPEDVAKELRDLKDDRKALVITSSPDEKLTEWIKLTVARRQFVLVLDGDTEIPGTRTVELPASVGEILAVLKPPEELLNHPAASLVVHPSGSVLKPGASDAEEETRGERDDPWSSLEWSQPDSEVADEDTPTAEVPVLATSDPEPGTAPASAAVPTVPQTPAAPNGAAVHEQPTASGPAPQPEAAPATRDMHRLIADRRLPTGGLCPVVVVFAGKGGVGKTSLAADLAERAVRVGGLEKVVLVDGNRGQPDQGKLLRTSYSGLPTIHDAAVSGELKSAIIGPSLLAKARGPRMPQLGFGMVMGPPADSVDSNVVSATVYGDVVEEARRFAELVVVDTQIMEGEDTSGLYDGLWVPLLRAGGGWALGLSDDDIRGVSNLTERMRLLTNNGVDRSRIMTALNRVGDDTPLKVDEAQALFAQYSTFLGLARERADIHNQLMTGKLPHDHEEVAPILDRTLFAVTGLPAFDQVHKPKPSKRRKVLSLVGGRRK